MDLTGKPFEDFRRKKEQKKYSRPRTKKTIERKDFEGNKLSFPLQTLPIKLNKTWKKHSDENC